MATSATETPADDSSSSSSVWNKSNNNNNSVEEETAGASGSVPAGAAVSTTSAGAAAAATTTATAHRIHMQLGSRKRKRKTISTAAAATLSGSDSSSSSDEDETPSFSTTSSATSNPSMEQEQQPRPDNDTTQHKPEGWRVKLYRLNADGSWDDCGTGRIVCVYKTAGTSPPPASSLHQSTQDSQLYQELGEPTLVMEAENNDNSSSVLLRTRILTRDAYQRQGDNIITWCEPFMDQANKGVDLALSFQDNAGCLDIWRQITNIQSRAAEWFRARGVLLHPEQKQQPVMQRHYHNGGQQEQQNHVEDMNNEPLDARQPQRHTMWTDHNTAMEQQQQQQQHFDSSSSSEENNNAEAVAVSMAAAAAAAYGGNEQQQQQREPKLPNPPTLGNLEEIADTIAAAQLQLRDGLAMYISHDECSYLKALLALFPPAESKGDYGALATLAACIKTVLLLNDPAIIELIVSDQVIFENVCSALEYDPDLRDKANHRWFIRERAKFRTVVKMEDEDLVATIHRSFRVTYLRDTLLRPTMDEGSLSTLTSLQTFTHVDLVKGVTSPSGASNGDSYLVQIIRVLGKQVNAIRRMEWEALETKFSAGSVEQTRQEPTTPPSQSSTSTSWKQHLAPQDGSLASRKIRRRGCLSFLRELFNMVRISLQQSDKDDFYAAIVCMEVKLNSSSDDERKSAKNGDKQGTNKSEENEKSQQSQQDTNSESKPQNRALDSKEESPVNLLALLGTVLADPTADVSEKGAVLEIISAIAMHDSSHIRRHCLDLQDLWKDASTSRDIQVMPPSRPTPNERRQVIFHCPSNDLILSLLFLLTIETDAGLLLQMSEIMRIILDTDVLGEHGPLGVGREGEDSEGVVPGLHPSMEQIDHIGGSDTAGSDQNQFLSMFYEHYIYWLVAPFQFTILHPVKVIPDSIFSAPSSSPLMTKILDTFKNGVSFPDPILHSIAPCAIRSSFSVELLNFCVRAHLFRMKFFLLRSRVLGSVLKVLTPTSSSSVTSGDRCLKLAAIRFLRAILSVKDEFYHRHIIQHNLFAPVFEAFRANPVGDNLVSSAIIEMCDYIHNQNIKSLIEYIVSKHLIQPTGPSSSPKSTTSQQGPSLEDVATPYVSTLTLLRKAYEDTVTTSKMAKDEHHQGENVSANGGDNSRYFTSMRPHVNMSEKAIEDQRKFREADEEESYFDADDDDEEQQQPQPPSVVSVDGGPETELHRTPRMFSLAQAPLMNSNNNAVPLQRGSQETEHNNDVSGSESNTLISSSEAAQESTDDADKNTTAPAVADAL